jgi:hypothetical protein
MRAILNEMVGTWNTPAIYVGCSGNFTVERVLAAHQRFRLHANDVTIYSGSIGSYLAGQPFRLTLRPAFVETLGWLAPYLDSPQRVAGTIMLVGRLLEAMRGDGTWKTNSYYERFIPAYRAQWERMHAKTCSRIDTLAGMLTEYHSGDVVPWAAAIPKDAGFISYPPFFSGDYESMFRKLDLVFDWDKPTFSDIGAGKMLDALRPTLERAHWILGLNHPLDELVPFLRGMTQTTNRGVPIYVYSSTSVRRVVIPAQQLDPVANTRLVPGQALGTRLQIAPLTQAQFQTLRSAYMNPGIKPGQPSAAYAVMVDDILIGAFALSVAPSKAAMDRHSTVYLLSDFPVAPTDYPRLSKLVLYAALSREAQLLAERLARKRVRSLFTTAFSNNPVSMKYRGLFDLHNRRENPDWSPDAERDPAAYYRQRYLINYVASVGAWTLAEGFSLWTQKHGKRMTADVTNTDH